MKLLRVGQPGAEVPAIVDAAGRIRSLQGIVPDIAGATLTPDGLARLRAIDPATLPELPADARIGPCVGQVGKFICIGLNYADHAAESNGNTDRRPAPLRSRRPRPRMIGKADSDSVQ